VQGIRLLAPIEFLSQPGARFLQRGDDTHFNEIPLWRFSFTLVCPSKFFRATSCSGELLTQFGSFHKFFNGSQPLGPFTETAAGERPAGSLGGAVRFTEFTRQLFQALLVGAAAPASSSTPGTSASGIL
jgi:hypothetical protein